ncbi:MAG: UPF0280 family protein [Thermoanaerobacterales bacterium]|nr:UPF0280 family protein [Bacillota bacterium]MDI6907435.1 UPF0280 family protein [Thermoanaerobacterales bacterium]
MNAEVRAYRARFAGTNMTYFEVMVKETDLCIGVRRERMTGDLPRRVETLVREARSTLEAYIAADPEFLHTLEPYPQQGGMPSLAREMAAAGAVAGVGPMAAVAGAFADLVGRYLARYSRDVIVENGGDVFLKATRRVTVGVYAGRSPFSERVGLEIPPEATPLGICTSSGTVGHSLSLGRADAVVILAETAALADAVATAAANRVRSAADLQGAVEFALGLTGIYGAVAIKDDRLAASGAVKLVPL